MSNYPGNSTTNTLPVNGIPKNGGVGNWNSGPTMVASALIDDGVTLTYAGGGGIKSMASAPGSFTLYDDTTGHKAIAVNVGTAILTKTGSAGTDYTLPSPAVGTDDGRSLAIISNTAFAHVVTVGGGGANKVNASGAGTLTFAAAVGSSIRLKAYNGVWLSDGAAQGVTIA